MDPLLFQFVVSCIFVFFLAFSLIPCAAEHEKDQYDQCGHLDPSNSVLDLLEFNYSHYDLFSTVPTRCFCHSDQPRSISFNFGRDPCYARCFPCDSVTPRCAVQGNCCNNKSNQIDFNLADETSFFNSFRCINPDGLAYSYLFQRSCPITFSDETKRRLCEDDLLGNEMTTKTENYVVDTWSGVSYYNTYCAECNGVNSTIPMLLKIECVSYAKVKDARNELELLLLVRSNGSLCKIVQKLPIKMNPTKCFQEFFVENREVISICNFTGLEKNIDLQVEEACLGGNLNPLLRVYVPPFTFKNIFCAVCNKNGIDSNCPHYKRIPPRFSPPFEYVFGNYHAFPRELPTRNEVGCSWTEWATPLGECTSFICTGGKSLTRINAVNGNVECVTSLGLIKGLFYMGSLVLKPLNYDEERKLYHLETTVESIAEIVVEKTISKFSSVIEIIGQRVKLSYKKSSTHDDFECYNSTHHNNSCGFQTCNGFSKTSLLFQSFEINFVLQSYQAMDRDSVEKGLVETITDPVLEIEVQKDCFLVFQSQWIYSSVPLLLNATSGTSMKRYDSIADTYEYVIVYIHYLLKRSDGYDNYEYEIIPLEVFSSPITFSDFILILPTLACPFVKMPSYVVRLISDTAKGSQTLSLTFDGVILETSDPLAINQIVFEITEGKDEYHICLKTLQSLKLVPIPTKLDSVGFFKYVLTVTCMTLSLSCLMITTLSYCLLPELRTVAGCNTLGLCISLLSSQSLLIGSSRVKGPGLFCTCIGMATYYSWIVVFCWSFNCCHHMFKVFTSTHVLGQNASEIIRKNTTFAIFIPALVIVFVIAISYILYNGESIGYGQRACAVDNALAIQIPMVVVSIGNFIMFLTVVCKIKKIRRQQNMPEFQSQVKHDFIIYIKLSTITGVFWILVFLGEIFDNEIIRSLAIFFNGSQGVLIFASFTFNRRVLQLFKEKIFELFSMSHTELSSRCERGRQHEL